MRGDAQPGLRPALAAEVRPAARRSVLLWRGNRNGHAFSGGAEPSVEAAFKLGQGLSLDVLNGERGAKLFRPHEQTKSCRDGVCAAVRQSGMGGPIDRGVNFAVETQRSRRSYLGHVHGRNLTLKREQGQGDGDVEVHEILRSAGRMNVQRECHAGPPDVHRLECRPNAGQASQHRGIGCS